MYLEPSFEEGLIGHPLATENEQPGSRKLSFSFGFTFSQQEPWRCCRGSWSGCFGGNWSKLGSGCLPGQNGILGAVKGRDSGSLGSGSLPPWDGVEGMLWSRLFLELLVKGVQIQPPDGMIS